MEKHIFYPFTNTIKQKHILIIYGMKFSKFKHINTKKI